MWLNYLWSGGQRKVPFLFSFHHPLSWVTLPLTPDHASLCRVPHSLSRCAIFIWSLWTWLLDWLLISCMSSSLGAKSYPACTQEEIILGKDPRPACDLITHRSGMQKTFLTKAVCLVSCHFLAIFLSLCLLMIPRWHSEAFTSTARQGFVLLSNLKVRKGNWKTASFLDIIGT